MRGIDGVAKFGRWKEKERGTGKLNRRADALKRQNRLCTTLALVLQFHPFAVRYLIFQSDYKRNGDMLTFVLLFHRIISCTG